MTVLSFKAFVLTFTHDKRREKILFSKNKMDLEQDLSSHVTRGEGTVALPFENR